MAQQAINLVNAKRPSLPSTRTVPTFGMRGGLGKTLLIAFLFLAISPLSLLAFLTYNQIRHETQQKTVASLETMIALNEAHLVNWAEGYDRELSLLDSTLNQGGDLSVRLAALQATDPTLKALILADRNTGEVIATSHPVETDWPLLRPLLADDRRLLVAPPSATGRPPLLAISHTAADHRLIGLLQWDALPRMVAGGLTEDDTNTYLVTAEGVVISAQGVSRWPLESSNTSQDLLEALQAQTRPGAYTNLHGIPVFGAYRWNPELQVALLAEKPQSQALATGNTLTAMVLGITLTAALITAAIAAVVTRRITSPIVQLTETAARMAQGDLNQRVAISRRDEIGVLARAFNRMAADLKTLYTNLEAKVAERTQQLQQATELSCYHAMQLTISAEIARIATSIRDLDTLLTTTAGLLCDTFELDWVSLYLMDDNGRWVVWQAGQENGHPLPPQKAPDKPEMVTRVMAERQRLVRPAGSEAGQIAEGLELGLPLCVRDRVLGVITLRSRRDDAFSEQDQMVYQLLADQISIAIENARAYAVERETVRKLQELDQIQSQFLTNMSHALRTPLNSIIGFSRLMLKELDGPLNDLQRSDLTAIHESGRQLLGLINDMLELSQLDLGTAPFSLSEVNLAEIVEGVMATARALARGKAVQLYEELPADLPLLYTDGQRLRQVILALLSNAVKFTAEGSIRLRIRTDDGQVLISVSDTGVGIPAAERAGLFAEAGHKDGNGATPGFGLAISKRVVEKLGGQIWVESEIGRGSTFTLSLPLHCQEKR